MGFQLPTSTGACRNFEPSTVGLEPGINLVNDHHPGSFCLMEFCKGFLCQKNPTHRPWSEFNFNLGTSPRDPNHLFRPLEAARFFRIFFWNPPVISWRWLSESWGYGSWVRTPKTDLERHKWYTSMIIYAPPKKIKDQWAWNLMIIFAWLWCRTPDRVSPMFRASH